jgi:hypothetical protein
LDWVNAMAAAGGMGWDDCDGPKKKFAGGCQRLK